MKLPRLITLMVIAFFLVCYLIWLTPKQRAYTVTILNGKSIIHYSAEMQVDSFKESKEGSMIVFVDSLMLPIKGDVITFKRN